MPELPTGLLTLIGVFAGLALLGILERWQHRRHLRRIPVRIHVNGTRGKSSVTRLIAAGLRAGGVRTCAKTTGTLARMIMPDGREYPLFRPLGANVIEQLRVVRLAARLRADALVIECMALQPVLQSISERIMVQATHGVITNARADHLDVMGPGEVDVALALAGTVPRKGLLFSGERKHTEIVAAAARDRHSDLHQVTEEDVAAVSDSEMSGFSYIEHRENVALALAVCQHLGVDRQTAVEGMWRGSPDPGVLASYVVDFFGRRFKFLNGFAANDPTSTESIWRRVVADAKPDETLIALVNCRADRPDRSRQLAHACATWPKADHYVLMGTGTYIFAREAHRAGIDAAHFSYAEGMRVEEIFELLADLSKNSSVIVGIANIGGQGMEVVRYFRNRSSQDVLQGAA